MFEQPMDVLKAWLKLINQGDLDGLMGLYHERAILIPTFANRLLDTPEKIRGYFEVLAGREELSLALHGKTVVVQPVRERLYSVCGIYCWRFAVDGQLLSFEARFSLILDLELANPILQHHSSQIPRTL
jgi:hypothetical protein